MAWVVRTALSLGVLNAILNILIFVLADFVTKLSSVSTHNLFLLQLQRNSRAWIHVESGSLVNRLRQKLARLRHFRSPTKLAIILVSTVLFLLFEMVAESGIDVSDRCHPYEFFTKDGICAGACSGDTSHVKNIESAMATQKHKWDCGSLVKTPLREGFPKNFTCAAAFVGEGKKFPESRSIIADGCTVHSFKLIPANSTKMWFRKHTKTFTIQWTDLELPGSIKPIGMGDYVGNGKEPDAFFVRRPIGHREGRIESEFFDYADRKDLMQGVLFDFMLRGKIVSVIYNSSPILSYKISCSRAAISTQDFERAIFVYRTTQFETRRELHPVENVRVGNSSTRAARPLTPCDVMKAIIAMKAVCPESCEGESFVYSKCGTYDLEKFVPVFGSLLILIAIAIVTVGEVQRRNAYVSVPASATQWCRYMARYFEEKESQECNFRDDRDESSDRTTHEENMKDLEFVSDISHSNTEHWCIRRRRC